MAELKPGLFRRGFGFQLVVSEVQTGLVAVGGVFVKNTLGDGLIDRRHRGMEQVARRGCVARCECSSETLDRGAHTRPIRPLHLRSFEGLPRPLQYGLFLLLDFSRLTLRHLSLLRRIAQTISLADAYGFVKQLHCSIGASSLAVLHPVFRKIENRARALTRISVTRPEGGPSAEPQFRTRVLPPAHRVSPGVLGGRIHRRRIFAPSLPTNSTSPRSPS